MGARNCIQSSSMDDIREILCQLERDGVRLWSAKGELRYRAQHGRLTADAMKRIRTRKTAIREYLESLQAAVATEPPFARRAPSDPVPFTFTQQWWSSAIQSFVTPNGSDPCNMRLCCEAIRIYGRLDLGSLRRSFEELIQRHESLRTRMVIVDGVPMQEVCRAHPCELEFIDLSWMSPKHIQDEARRLAVDLVYESVGPWFAARILKLGDHDHVLIVGINHVIADGVSMSILSRDLWALYSQSVRGLPGLLPDMPIQFADYAVWQHRNAKWWMDERGGYWKERLADAPGPQFPHEGLTKGAHARSMNCSIKFGESLSAGLRELSRRECTTLVMSVLTIYAATVFRWQGTRDLVVRFMTTGRDCSELENIIGFLASVLHFRIQMDEDDTFLSLLRRVSSERNIAYQNNDYGRMSVLSPMLDCQRSTFFLWQLRADLDHEGTVRILTVHADDALTAEPFPTTPVTDIVWYCDTQRPPEDPGLELWDSVNGITGVISYRSDLFSSDTIERFCRNFRSFAAGILARPRARIMELCYS